MILKANSLIISKHIPKHLTAVSIYYTIVLQNIYIIHCYHNHS